MYSWRRMRERLFKITVFGVAILALTPFFHLIIVVFINGLPTILEAGLEFFVGLPPTPLSRELGGIAPSLVGTFLMTMISLPITIVLGLFTAILVTEFPKSRISILVDTVAKSLSSVPTIAVSMAMFSLVVVLVNTIPELRAFLNPAGSALTGSLALVIIALPFSYTYFSTFLRSVPATYKEAAYSIGMSRWAVIVRVVIPVIKKSILVAVLMTMARIMGETAALLFTAGRYRSGLPASIISPVDAIPLLIFDYILSPFEVWHRVAWGATLILLLFYMLIFFVVKVVVKEVKLV
ncbi:MAG: ABC transporter permease subunit [Thermosphaera sp.]|nr:ABC transporter permease subunit [Thermosphaera sp.]